MAKLFLLTTLWNCWIWTGLGTVPCLLYRVVAIITIHKPAPSCVVALAMSVHTVTPSPATGRRPTPWVYMIRPDPPRKAGDIPIAPGHRPKALCCLVASLLPVLHQWRFWRRKETPSLASPSISPWITWRKFARYPGDVNIDQRSLCCTWCRESCSIEEADTVTLTGGHGLGHTHVTLYHDDGAKKSLPELNHGRYQHACGVFTRAGGSIVCCAENVYT